MTPSNPPHALGLLEECLGYTFRRQEILRQALTHPSYLHEAGTAGEADYQRLEFLGDAVLGMLVAELLVAAYPDWSEGELSRLRARLCGQELLAEQARRLGLGNYVRLGRGEEGGGGRTKDSILADLFEALLAAIYLDAGLETARSLVVELFGRLVAAPDSFSAGRDSKSELQELLAARQLAPPAYHLISEDGPPHQRTFRYAVLLENQVIGQGEGASKKLAQQHAALQALNLLRQG